MDDRHSTTGILFLMAGSPISWLSKKQQIAIVQWEIVLLMQYCDRVDQSSMKLSTVFVEVYSNIRRGAIQIYIPLQKYVSQELWSI